MSNAPPAEEAPAGLPGWVMTFADLMTLLMCFFVLMLSFSEMDVAKFKQLAGSMQEAFGVQAEIEVKTIPKGTSLIAQEFSPGRPEQTILNEVRQFTVNSNMNSLDIGQKRAIEIAEQERRAETQAEALREALAREIADGKLLIRRESTNVIVQILERDSFPSGSAALESGFLPTLAKIGALLGPMTGAVTVSGHTDNVPISTSQYRSNWDLSAARAVTVAHELLDAGMEPERIMISGHADTQPRASNDTAAGRALNRRIDITLVTNRSRHGTWVEDGDAPPANDGPAANDSAAATEPTATSPPTPTAEPAAAAEPQATAQPAGGGPGV
jgi:chemotaxis protein MotB